MKICLIDGNQAASLPEEAAGYVGQLGPALAEEHRVSILTIDLGLAHLVQAAGRVRAALVKDQPDLVHINNVSGSSLASIVFALRESTAARPSLVLGLHSDRLLRHSRALNRVVTGSIDLVVSPSSSLLDRHLAANFFVGAMREVIPYEMPYHTAQLVDAYRRLLRTRRTGHLGDRAA